MIAMNPKIEALLLAIRDHEGWHPIGHPKHPDGSLTYRYHNPGALRRSPFEIDNKNRFSVFASDFVGYMALHWDLLQKSKGNTVTDLGPQSTLRDLIFTWAPPSDSNDTEKYLAEVVKKTGFPETITLQEIFSK